MNDKLSELVQSKDDTVAFDVIMWLHALGVQSA